MTTLDSTKADDIALVIEEAIVSGELEPGTVLRQEQLSEQFNVSRTPIREALRRLAALGLVSFVPNRGVRVRTLSREELREAFLVRAELESLATELATPRMTADDLRRLDEAELRFGVLTLEESGYSASRHQREVGAGYFDRVVEAVSGGESSTLALRGSTEEAQFATARESEAA